MMLQQQMIAQQYYLMQSQNTSLWGGSLPGYAVIQRGRQTGATLLRNDYFGENPTYESKFRRRFRMSRELFLRIRRSLKEHSSLWKTSYDAARRPGTGNFATVQAAVDSVPAGNSRWIRISIKPGLYKEKVTIPTGKECIYLEGCGYSQTVIAWNDHGQTDTSATFSVWADNFVAKGIAFQNFYNTVLEATGSQERAPALAVRIYGDKSAFHECGFIGFQDTVWDVKGRHYFNSCYIEGAVDFIWGGGQSFYEDCTVNVTAGMLPRTVAAGFITAQGRQSSTDPSGFVFEGGSVAGTGQAYLGRAYGPYSRVIFHGTTFDSVVFPLGWDAWHYQGTENNFMYVEAGCQGLGADTSKRVSWEKKDVVGSQLQEFSRDVFINQDGWLGNQPQSSFWKVHAHSLYV